MQSNKTSKKTSSPADKKSAPTAEEVLSASAPAAKRATRSSKKNDLTDMASVKHSHKPSSNVVSSAAPIAKPLNDTPSRSVHHQEIAELAYRYWAERGFRGGNPEEDWLRAEKTLSER
jgi:Protein of unknown function (DUF2934)